MDKTFCKVHLFQYFFMERIIIILILIIGAHVSTLPAYAQKARPISKEKPQPKQTLSKTMKLKRSSGTDSELDRYAEPNNDYITVYKPGRSWIYKFFDPENPNNPVIHSKHTVDGDSIIGQVNAIRIRIEYPDLPDVTPHYVYVSEVAGISYQCKFKDNFASTHEKNNFTFIPVYNFHLDKGAKIFDTNLVVKDIFNIEIKGISRQCMEIEEISTGSTKGYWIESIGATNEIMEIPEFEFIDNIPPGYTYSLIQCFDGDNCIYDENDAPKASGITTVVNTSDSEPTVYYNLQGVKIASPKPRQLYIEHKGSQSRIAIGQ